MAGNANKENEVSGRRLRVVKAGADADQGAMTIIEKVLRRANEQQGGGGDLAERLANFQRIVGASPATVGARTAALEEAVEIAGQVLADAFVFAKIKGGVKPKKRTLVDSPWRAKLKRLIELSGLKITEVAALLREGSGERGFAHRTLQCWLSDPESSTHRSCPEWPVSMLADHLLQTGCIEINSYIDITGAAPKQVMAAAQR